MMNEEKHEKKQKKKNKQVCQEKDMFMVYFWYTSIFVVLM